MAPLVSVIVPVHNAADTLPRCVESVLNQTLKSLELILVDDGSSDASPALCDSFGRIDDRVVVVHRPHGGVSRARNDGLRRAAGDFVAFLDSDDWAESTMLEDMVALIGPSGSDVVVSGFQVDIEDASGRLLSSRRVVPEPWVIRQGGDLPVMTAELINLLGYAWNKLYRRSLLSGANPQFPADMNLFEDLVFTSTALCSAASIAFVDQTPVHYVHRQRGSHGTAFRADFLEQRVRALEALRGLLQHWGVRVTESETVASSLGVAALRDLARRTSEHPSWSIRQKGDDFSRARPLADQLVQITRLTARQRIEFRALRTLPAVVVLLAFTARRRLRKGRTDPPTPSAELANG